MQVLLVVPQCNPFGIGESLVAYKLVKGLTQRFDTTVITMTPHNLPEGVAPHLPDAKVLECAPWPLNRVSERFDAIVKPSYVKFYYFAKRTIKSLLEWQHFSVFNQIGPLGMRYPSPLASLPVRYIMGPVGGTLPTPPAFKSDERAFPWYYRLRALDQLRLSFDPVLRKTYRRADAVVGIAPYVEDILQGIGIHRFEAMSEVALDKLPELNSPAREKPQGLRLLYVGRVVRTKGLIYAIRALANLRDIENVFLDVVGDGPDLATCRAEAERLNVSDLVRFHGRKPRLEIDAFYRNADVFVFPSFREPTGNVVFEAMSFGLPVVVADYGGPAAIIKPEFGRRIAIDCQDGFPGRIATALRSLYSQRDRFPEMAKAARREIEEHHMWHHRVNFLSDLYREMYG